MRVATFPSSLPWRANPMLDLIEAALREQGVEFVDVGSDYLSWRWLVDHHRDVDVLHFHWTHYHYAASSRWASTLSMIKFSIKLMLARLLGYRVVWTMHNVLPHERRYPELDWLARLVTAHLAHSVIVHCEEGRRQLWRKFRRRRKVFTAYMGHYIEAHPNTISREEARANLGIGQDRMVFLFFGGVRPYKGVEELISEFMAMPDEQLLLLLVGPPLDEDYRAHILALAQCDSRIRAVLELISIEDAQLYFNAADVVVLPFTNILTSTSAITALSFGKPLIASALGCIPEIVNEGSGILYDPADSNGLRQALQRCLTLDLNAMGQRAYEHVQRFTWEALAEKTLEAYGVKVG